MARFDCPRWIVALLCLLPFGPLAAEEAAISAPAVVHVSPTGNDTANGSETRPVATVEKASALLPHGGTILLHKGLYRQQVTLSAEGTPPPLLIKGEEGVLFDGGQPLSGWEPAGPSLYSMKLPDSVQETRSNLHLWDRSRLLRLTRLADEASVRISPGTFFLRDDGLLIIHLAGGQKPEAIECNRISKGIVIQRSNVTLEGIAFRNYFRDGYSAAVSVDKVKETAIVNCRFENVGQAVTIAPLAEGTLITKCDIRFAGTAINSRGNQVTITDTVFEGATGTFAIPDLLPVLNCAIRIYFPAEGVTLRGNVTAGFHYGLRIKTGEGGTTAGKSAHPAFIIEHNTFVDGISMTPFVQGSFREGDRFSANIIGTAAAEATLVATLQKSSGRVEANYAYPIFGKSEAFTIERLGGNNETGAIPFANLAGGDLRANVELPRVASGDAAGSAITQVAWRTSDITAPATPLEPAQESAAFKPFPRKEGKPATIHVQAGASRESADGTEEHPYPVLQAALDQTIPGDVVLLSKGVFIKPATMTRSGTKDAPITLRGAGASATILDGVRRSPVPLSIIGAKHILVERMQFRWFREAGIQLERCESVRIEDCSFLNSELWTRGVTTGFGIFAERSPKTAIIRCLFARNRVGIKLVASPEAVIEQNTGFRNLNTALEMVRSCQKSVIRRNSFGFSSHAAIYLWEPDEAALRSLICDENNFAMRLYDYLIYNRGPDPDLPPPLAIPPRYGSVAGGKAVVDMLHTRVDNSKRTRYSRLKEWQKASGKDQNSTFADPQYSDPVKGDFRLLPGSPNLLPNGGFIGAFGSVPAHDVSRH